MLLRKLSQGAFSGTLPLWKDSHMIKANTMPQNQLVVAKLLLTFSTRQALTSLLQPGKLHPACNDQDNVWTSFYTNDWDGLIGGRPWLSNELSLLNKHREKNGWVSFLPFNLTSLPPSQWQSAPQANLRVTKMYKLLNETCLARRRDSSFFNHDGKQTPPGPGTVPRFERINNSCSTNQPFEQLPWLSVLTQRLWVSASDSRLWAVNSWNSDA